MKAKLKKIGAAVVAAVTSPDAVKAEKSVLALAITRALLAAGATAGTVGLVEAIIRNL